MRDSDPRQDQKSRVVGNEPDIAPACFCTPADITIAAAQLSCPESFSDVQWPPRGRSFRIGVSGCQQQLRLMRRQRPDSLCARRPPSETSLRQALCGQPESLAVILQNADGGSTPGPEDQQVAGKRIGVRRANSIAASHNSSGIAARPFRLRLQSSKRAYTFSTIRPSVSRRGIAILPAAQSATERD